MKNINQKNVAVALALAVAAGASQAAAVDVAAVVTDIAAQAAPIGLIGSAVLLIYVAVKAFKWVRSALS
nr:major capsid protein [uncultured Rhodoferax sp.]